MPPRLRSPNFSASVTSCPSVRPQSITQPSRAARDFSQSSCRQVTQRRRKFYEWLNGPGRALKQPLPGSTNYLGAYDRYGNLVRATYVSEQAANDTKPAEEGTEAGSTEGKDAEGAKASSGQESLENIEKALREREQKEKAEKKPDEAKLPEESAEDLQPFPANRFFRSQPVLSEELREAIYQFVVKEGKTVPLASITFGVSNERVGAVVRLKQMEKQWIAQVCLHFSLYSHAFHDEHKTFD